MGETKANTWLHKQFMAERDFEIEHAVDASYHEIEPHYHEFYELFFFVSGHVDYIIGDDCFTLRRGDLLIIPPDVYHSPIFRDFGEKYERFVLWVSARCMERIIRQDEDLCAFQREELRHRYLLRSLSTAWSTVNENFSAIYRAWEKRQPCWKSESLCALTSILVAYNRALLGAGGETLHGARSTVLTEILHYVSANLTGDLSLETVSRVFYRSKFSISHLFKQDMHISYYQYVIQKRLMEGKNLLLADVPAAKVWEQCGFSDYTGFYRAFRKWYGVSPSNFRKMYTEMLAPTEDDG